MIEQLKHIDTELFLAINSRHNSFFDTIMWLASGKLIWIPLYLFLTYILYKLVAKKIIAVLLASLLLVVFTDQGANLIKNTTKRYRPCHNTELSVHLVNAHCGGTYGFVSSHAANTFGISTFVILLLRFSKKRRISYILFSWVMLVAYSRIYLGAHYPIDIIGGWIFGLTGGILAYLLYTNVLQSKFK